MKFYKVYDAESFTAKTREYYGDTCECYVEECRKSGYDVDNYFYVFEEQEFEHTAMRCAGKLKLVEHVNGRLFDHDVQAYMVGGELYVGVEAWDTIVYGD